MASSLPGDFPEELNRPGYGFIVADGMGGHPAGQVASRTAIALFIDFALQTPDWLLGRDSALLGRVMERTAGRFRAVNELFLAQARAEPRLRGAGTTLSMALSLGDDLIVAHVGDSPAYLFREGRLHRLTTDHTVAEERRGLDPDAARFRNVLTRAIGIPESGGGPDVGRFRLADGDRLLLCTDGLPDVVGEGDIARELGQARTADDATRRLVELALAGGGRDNVTALVAGYSIPGAGEQ
jgi:protein phosphatase